MRAPVAFAAALALALLATGCRQGMYDQEKYEPLERSTFFEDGASARPLVPGTIPRGFLRADQAFWTGLGTDGQPVDTLPMPVTESLLERGRQRFEAYCSMCHDRAGTGNGMVVQRGYRKPPSYHDPRLRAMPVGYFFNVMTQGFGQMPSYASQIPPDDRWAIAAYVRVLQSAQHEQLAELPAEARSAAETALANPGGAPPADAENHDASHH